MPEHPIPQFDPAKLKAEPALVDLGAEDETGHDHVSHKETDGSVPEPSIGSEPTPQ